MLPEGSSTNNNGIDDVAHLAEEMSRSAHDFDQARPGIPTHRCPTRGSEVADERYEKKAEITEKIMSTH